MIDDKLSHQVQPSMCLGFPLDLAQQPVKDNTYPPKGPPAVLPCNSWTQCGMKCGLLAGTSLKGVISLRTLGLKTKYVGLVIRSCCFPERYLVMLTLPFKLL